MIMRSGFLLKIKKAKDVIRVAVTDGAVGCIPASQPWNRTGLAMVLLQGRSLLRELCTSSCNSGDHPCCIMVIQSEHTFCRSPTDLHSVSAFVRTCLRKR